MHIMCLTSFRTKQTIEAGTGKGVSFTYKLWHAKTNLLKDLCHCHTTRRLGWHQPDQGGIGTEATEAHFFPPESLVHVQI